MHILFVYGLGKTDIGRPTIESQAEALEEIGIRVSLEPLAGSGLVGYISKFRHLRQRIKEVNPDIIHAHYSYNGFIASIATRKPVVTSLMGCDVNNSGLWKVVIRFFVKHIWVLTIVKSKEMENNLGVVSKLIHVVPNGVNTEKFKPMDKDNCRKQIGWRANERIVLFGGDPKNRIKNYDLANQSFEMIKGKGYVMKSLGAVSPDDMPLLLNASDVLLLTSHSEGSPNVVKEAMACTLPVVSTDVGDVSWLLANVTHSYIAEYDPADIAHKLDLVLESNARSNGSDKIVELGLGSSRFSSKIRSLYEGVMDSVSARSLKTQKLIGRHQRS